MAFASISMIRKKKFNGKEDQTTEPRDFNYFMIFTEGMVVGVLTGLVGAGGGFLIIPALVVFARIPMKTAVGTSLLIISAKSLIGFLGDIGQREMDWSFLLIFTTISVIGIFAGSHLNKHIPGEKLKKTFGYFVLVMAIYILTREIFFG